MTKFVYCSRDVVANALNTNVLFLYDSADLAKRDFVIGMKDNPIKDDVELWFVGTLDTDSMLVTCDTLPTLFMRGKEL